MRFLIATGVLAISVSAMPALAQQAPAAAPAAPAAQKAPAAAPAAQKAPAAADKAAASPAAGIAATSNEPGKVAGAGAVKASASITAIDSASRKITLKSQDGKTFDVIAGPEVKNFNQINVGDKVTVEYLKAFSAEVKKTAKGETKPAASMTKETESASAKPGDKPAGAEGVKVTILADVVAVDKKKKTITLKGPNGKVVKLDVKNPDHFNVVKKGDQVEIVYVEAMAISVTSSK